MDIAHEKGGFVLSENEGGIHSRNVLMEVHREQVDKIEVFLGSHTHMTVSKAC